MEKEFVPYELAVKLKALNYPQNEYFNWYDGKGNLQYNHEYDEYDFSENCCSAPTFSQAFRWFREKYGVHSSPRKFDESKWWVEWGAFTSPIFETFEEAEISWLNYLIEIVENELNKSK